MKTLFGKVKAVAGSKLKDDIPRGSELGSSSSSGDSSSRGAAKGMKKGSKKTDASPSTANGEHHGSAKDPSAASPKPRNSKPRALPSSRSAGASSSEGSGKGSHLPSSRSTPQGRKGNRKAREATGSRDGKGAFAEEGAVTDAAADFAASRRGNTPADATSDTTATSSVGYNSSSDLPPSALNGNVEASDLQRGSDDTPYFSFDIELSGSLRGRHSQQGQLESTSARSTETQALSVGSHSGNIGDGSLRSDQAMASTPRGEDSTHASTSGGTGNVRGFDRAQGAGRPSATGGSSAESSESLRPAGNEGIEGSSTPGGVSVARGRAQGAAGVPVGGRGTGVAGRGCRVLSGATGEAAELPLLEALEACEAGDEEEQLRGLRSLRSISRGTKEARLGMVSEGVVETMLRMQHIESEEVLNLVLLVLLNVSCDEESARNMGVIIPFIGTALQQGSSKVKESAAAVVFSLSLHTFHRESLLSSSVVSSLVPILISGSDQGKRDCCKALFHLSYLPKSYKILIKAGAVGPAVDLLYPPDSKIAEKATCLLANIARCPEGCEAIAESPEGMFNLVEILNEGSPLAKEFAAAALLLIAQSDRQHRKSLMLESPFIALDGLQNTGSARAKLKASALLKLLGEQKEEDESYGL